MSTVKSKLAARTVAAETGGDVVAASAPVVDGTPELRRRELIDLVVESSGVKKKFAKPVVEAMLATLGSSLAEGRAFNLPPLGKLRINRAQEKDGNRIIVCKVRQNKAAETPADHAGDTDAT